MDENMLRMQQEAAERVRQMQERARRFVSEEPPSAAPMDIPAPPGPAGKPQEAHRSCGSKKPDSLSVSPRGGSFLSDFGRDKEQLFLLMIAVLLVKNDAPIELVLALLYLAM